MTFFETLGEIGTLLGGAAGGGGVVGGLVWLGGKVLSNRKHARANAAMVERTDREADAAEAVAREQGAAAVVPQLIARVGTLETRVEESDRRCEELRAHDRAEMEARIDARDRRCEELREHDRAESERRLDALRADLGYVAARVSESGVDDTGLHRIVRKSPTPPEPMPVHPDPHSALSGRREIPPPKRGKE